MDKQLIFFLMLAFLFLLGGFFSVNFIMQVAGITIILFLIYDNLFNYKDNEKYRKNYVKRINFVGILGHLDLTLGILLLIWSIYGIVPLGLIFFFTIILLLKAFIFVWGGDVASMIDIISSMIIFSSVSAEFPMIVFTVISIYLIQKGIFSFFYGS